MATVTICDSWTLDIPEYTEDTWFMNWVLNAPTQVGKHFLSGWLAYQSLAEVIDVSQLNSAVEYFGGIGAQTLMIQDAFAPAEHHVYDYSDEAVEHLTTTFAGTPVQVSRADSYNPASIRQADLVGLDFGDLTAWKAQAGRPAGDMLERVFMLEPKAVVITDVAARYLHLQKVAYEPILGQDTCDSYEDYLDAFAAHIWERFGYQRVTSYDNHWSSVTAFVPDTVDLPTDTESYVCVDPNNRSGMVVA